MKLVIVREWLKGARLDLEQYDVIWEFPALSRPLIGQYLV